ncbi:MAG TPA: hypothetical protein VMV72_17925, partial [Verrucomicrobiae bacterium]|nr:hypothetical protein [Verrucomicrobiae bacterium]
MKSRHTLALCLASLLFAGCTDTTEIRSVFSAAVAPRIVATMFYIETNRWPASREELTDYAARHPGYYFTNSLYSTLTLTPGTNGSLDICGVLAPPLKVPFTGHLDR